MPSPSTTLFPPEIESYRTLIDENLDRLTQFDSDCPNHLRQAIRYCLLAPGKRIRPLLVLTAAQVCGGDPAKAMPAACAVEMIHNYSLIHDDLPAMDNDELRRGKPTCHIQFDEATAILAGDGLIPLAFETIAREVKPVEAANDCIMALAVASGPCQLVGGQADDLNMQFADGNIETLEKIHRRKTGALLAVSLELGAITAGASLDKRKSLIQFGKHLGLAFQIVDDLLDLRSSTEKLGKKAGKDAEAGKQTYPSVIGEQASEDRAEEKIKTAVDALKIFGESAKPLEFIANFVVSRKL